MFDIAWSELALIGAVALIVIGPKDLPKVMRTLGQWTRKARLLAGEFHHNIDELVRQAELEDVRKQVEQITPSAIRAKAESIFDPKDIEAAIVGDTKPAAPVQPQAGSSTAGNGESTPAGNGESAAAAEVPVLPEGMLPPVPPVEEIPAQPVPDAQPHRSRAEPAANSSTTPAASRPDSGSSS